MTPSPEDRLRTEIPDGYRFAIYPVGAYGHIGDPRGQANQLLHDVGLRPIELDHWIDIAQGDAELILVHVLHESLAFGMELRPMSEAERVARLFLAEIGKGRHFTNARFHNPGRMEWTPASQLTFDAGVVAVGARHIGILWAEEDD